MGRFAAIDGSEQCFSSSRDLHQAGTLVRRILHELQLAFTRHSIHQGLNMLPRNVSRPGKVRHRLRPVLRQLMEEASLQKRPRIPGMKLPSQ